MQDAVNDVDEEEAKLDMRYIGADALIDVDTDDIDLLKKTKVKKKLKKDDPDALHGGGVVKSGDYGFVCRIVVANTWKCAVPALCFVKLV